MKNNQPITENEVHFSENDIIVSTTDTKGVITSASPAFCRISGFKEAELIGQSHNVVRHPHMPPAVFAWMWRSISAGRTWRGVIKNRCKNGDFYWVDATVLPIYEKGRIEGYRSLREKPTPSQVRKAARLYQDIFTGRRKNPFTEREPHGLFSRLKLWHKLLALVVLAVLLTAAPTWMLSKRFNRELDFSVSELQGIDYSRESIRLLQLLQQHRALSTLALAGNKSVMTEWRDFRRQVNAQVEKLDKMNPLLLSMGLSAEWNRLRGDWQKNAADIEGLDVSASLRGHNDLISRLLIFNRKFADMSKMSFDPEIESYYLLCIANRQIPELADRISQISSFTARAMNRKKLLSEEASEIAHLLRDLPSDAALIVENAEKASARKSGLDMEIRQRMESLQGFIDANQTIQLKSGWLNGEAHNFLESSTSMTDQLYQLGQGIQQQAEYLLNTRIQELNHDRALNLGGELGLLALFLVMSGFIVSGVLKPVTAISATLGELGRGEMPSMDDADYGPEFNRLKEDLNLAVSAVRSLIADVGMLSQMAAAGKLDIRADANAHQGVYCAIIKGVNATLDSIVGPLDEVREILLGMEQGDLTRRIDGIYQGRLQELADAASNTAASLSGIRDAAIPAIERLVDVELQISTALRQLAQPDRAEEAGRHLSLAAVQLKSCKETLENLLLFFKTSTELDSAHSEPKESHEIATEIGRG